MTMTIDQIKRVLEAAIITATEPVSLERLSQLFFEENRPKNEDLREALKVLEEDYSARGVALKKVATGYRFQVQTDVAPYLATWIEDPPARLSRALLETLALIAYKQPLTRAEIEEIRGVAVSSNILRNLLERDWVKVVGHKDVPGKPALYATTPQFLNDLNLQSLADLPMLRETQEEQGAEQLALELALESAESVGSDPITEEENSIAPLATSPVHNPELEPEPVA